MNRTQFMQQLHKKLKKLPMEEYQNAMAYYNEYFDDAGIENEQQVIENLGSPNAIPAQILTEFAMKDLKDFNFQSIKRNVSLIWIILGATLAAPLTLSFSIVAISMGLVAIILLVVFALLAVVFLLTGIAIALIGLMVATQSLATTILFIGSGMILFGIGILLGIFMLFVFRKCFAAIAKITYRKMPKAKGVF